MRIATLIIGLVLGAIMFFQAVLVAALGDAANTEDDGAAGGIGLLMCLMWLVACGLVIPAPRVAMILFAVAGLFGILGGTGTDYSDLVVWGVISFVLAVFSYLGYRGKRSKDIKERIRDEQQAQMLAHNQQMAAQLAAQNQWQQQQAWAAYQAQQANQPQPPPPATP